MAKGKGFQFVSLSRSQHHFKRDSNLFDPFSGDLHRRQERRGRDLRNRRLGRSKIREVRETSGTAENEGEERDLPEQQKLRKPGFVQWGRRQLGSVGQAPITSNQVERLGARFW